MSDLVHSLQLEAAGQLNRRQFAAAADTLQSAAAAQPANGLTWTMLGSAFGELARWDDRARAQREALRLTPTAPVLRWNCALAALQRGEYGSWSEYRWGLVTGARKLRTLQPAWDGSGEGHGQRLLVWAEQGIGDTLMMLRFVPRIRAAFGFAEVTLEVFPELVPLLAGWPGADRVIPQPLDLNLPAPFDHHVSLMDLPACLGLNSPAEVRCEPYLPRPGAPRDPAAPLRVGLVWAGSPEHASDWRRSIDPELLRPLLSVPGCVFTSLQVGRPCPAWLADAGGQIQDWADTHRLLGEIDLLIAVDTGLAHLAGACGVPTWILLPAVSDWRWGLDTNETPWYVSVRLYRQPRPGDWEAPLRVLRQALEQEVTGRRVA